VSLPQIDSASRSVRSKLEIRPISRQPERNLEAHVLSAFGFTQTRGREPLCTPHSHPRFWPARIWNRSDARQKPQRPIQPFDQNRLRAQTRRRASRNWPVSRRRPEMRHNGKSPACSILSKGGLDREPHDFVVAPWRDRHSLLAAWLSLISRRCVSPRHGPTAGPPRRPALTVPRVRQRILS